MDEPGRFSLESDEEDGPLREHSNPKVTSPFAAYQKDLGTDGGHTPQPMSQVSPARLTTAALAAAASASTLPQPRLASREDDNNNNNNNNNKDPVAPSTSDHPNSASAYPFVKLCALFEGILSAVNKAQQYARLEAFWRSLPRTESFFPFMRLLMPHLDNVRPLYRLRESKLARLYVGALGLHERSGEAQRLLQWKDPAKSSVETTSFSDVVFVALQRRGGVHQRDLTGMAAAFTVEGINHFLDEVAAAESTAARQGLLMESLLRTTPLEQKWLIRIILKDMKFRMTHQTLLSAFHPTALDKYNNTSDLAYVCEACLEEIQKPTPGSSAAGIFLFQPLRPMLASPVTAKKLEQLLATEAILLEPKYDGERIMVHVDSQKAMYWTRNAKNYTALYAPKFDSTLRSSFVVGSQVVIPHVANLNSAQSVDDEAAGEAPQGGGAERAPVTLDNAIFDGELLVYDAHIKGFIPFGLNRSFATGGEGYTAARAGGDDMAAGVTIADEASIDGSHRWFCYMIFDIVFLNGKSLMHLPLSARRGILKYVTRPLKHRMEIVPSQKVTTTQQILTNLQRMMDANLEGVVLKAGSSIYVPAERKSKWVKLKPDHIAGLSDTVDLVIVGGYHGTKFGARRISHFLMAVWVNGSSRAPTDPGALFHTVCKIGNGFTSEELSTIQAALNPHWETMSTRQTIPEWLDGWKPVASDLIPDVYVHPAHSIVLELYGYAFVASANYRVGYTLRFPRMLRVRLDKSLADATDLHTLAAIKDASKDALARRAAVQGSGTDIHDGEGLLTVMKMKWARRQHERMEAAGTLPDSQNGPGMGSLPQSLRGGGVAQWAAMRVAGGAAAAAASIPQRTIANITRRLGVTRLDPNDAVLDDLFAGYEFCVLFTSEETCTVQPDVGGNRVALERCLLQHGAKIVANPGPQTSLLLASSRGATKAENWVKLCLSDPLRVSRKYAATDVVHCDWAMSCVLAKTVVPLAPRFVLYASPTLSAKMKLLLDAYEDSFYEPATVASLAYSLSKARAQRAATVVGPASAPASGVAGATSQGTSLPLLEAVNRTHQLKAELGILSSADCMCLAAVDVIKAPEENALTHFCPSSAGTSSTANSEEERARVLTELATFLSRSCAHAGSSGAKEERLGSPLVKHEKEDSNGGLSQATGIPSGTLAALDPGLSEDILGTDETPLARLSKRGAKRRREGCGPKEEGEERKSRHCTEAVGGAVKRKEKEKEEEEEGAPLPLSACTPLYSPDAWSVPQLLTVIRLVSAADCAVADSPAAFAKASHVVDRQGQLRKVS